MGDGWKITTGAKQAATTKRGRRPFGEKVSSNLHQYAVLYLPAGTVAVPLVSAVNEDYRITSKSSSIFK